jgi:hypothetical protein
MARRAAGDVNKSEEIRKLIKSGMRKPAQVQAALAERGIKVSRQMVSTIKSNMRGRKSARRNGRRPAEASVSAPSNDVRTLARFIRGVHDIGGVAEARKILKELE